MYDSFFHFFFVNIIEKLLKKYTALISIKNSLSSDIIFV